MLLVVAESTGSSPGRARYKMAVSEGGELFGSIGGGIMEVSLVERARTALSEPGVVATGFPAGVLTEQIHQKNAPNASGMICSGRQTVILQRLNASDADTVDSIIDAINNGSNASLTITRDGFTVGQTKIGSPNIYSFEKSSEKDFLYRERLGSRSELYIIGGGHCALALSEVISRLDFRIHIFDDRPELNTLDKNNFADEITIIDDYARIAEHLPPGNNVYVVVMTLGFVSDEIVIRSLIDRNIKYFGVLGSKAKMATLLRQLNNDGFSEEQLGRIRAPVGLAINSRTPEEIAISIAAEIIAVKNGAEPYA